MEYVRTIFVNMYPLHFLAVHISSKMRTLVYYKTAFAVLAGKVCKCGPKKTRTYYEIIVLFIHLMSRITPDFIGITIV
jgi:hypothetical protein